LLALADFNFQVWRINRERAIDYLNTRNRIYVVDGFAGWDKEYQIKVRVVSARAYHALFMRNMLIRPDRKDLEHFHPDYTIYNAGSFPANRYTEGMTSSTSVAISFAEKEMVILGTEYAGEMKKGIFTVLFYEMPVKHNILTLHSSANEGPNGDVTIFFGLSGTGKTTLSADPHRFLIGDDEHCWSNKGIFNIEGGVSFILDLFYRGHIDNIVVLCQVYWPLCREGARHFSSYQIWLCFGKCCI
jgi:phosphoenolpyruvate carboxykinase (ATP)